MKLRKSKRKLSMLVAVFVLFTTVFGFVNLNAVKAAGTTLIIHYGEREDKKYEGWNVWVWEEGKDGQSIAFKNEDDYGKIAIYQTANMPEKIGFIIRLNEWEDKDIAEDRMVEIKNGVTEIWVASEKSEFSYTPPKGFVSYDFEKMEKERLGLYDKPDSLKINLHYFNYTGNYDHVEVLTWKGTEAPASYPMVKKDDFGAVFHVGHSKEDKDKELEFTIFDHGINDSAISRKLDLSKAVNRVLDVYTVEGNSQIWYKAEEVEKTPLIVSAAFNENTTKQIEVSLSKAIDTTQKNTFKNFVVTDEKGNSYGVHHIWNETPGILKSTKVVMDEELSLDHSYTITYKDYTPSPVDITRSFSSEGFEKKFTYDGDDLGVSYGKEKTAFRVWAPTASEVLLNLYKTGDGEDLMESIPMIKDVKGTWLVEKAGDLNGVYYTYLVAVDGKKNEAVDPYARAAGVNGKRGMVVDLTATNPEGFDKDKKPAFKNMTDAIIYELHIRDLSADASSGIQHSGKYLGLTETGTKNQDGIATGLDHIKDLGVTHIHLLPSFDYASVDESKEGASFNWGYDPQNYNVPEGSYATDAQNGAVRVKEFKEMVQTLHKNNLRVVMDVVYNHTYVFDSNLQKIVPNYYYRMIGDKCSNASGCGNETASERAMFRKYIVDSVVYWAKEYHIDGFRFDLMGIHDIETMNAVREALNEIDPSIILYGEGWTSGSSPLPDLERALKANTSKLNRIAAFSDDIRDTLKGNVFDSLDKGFVSGKEGMENDVRYAVVASTEHPQVDYNSYEKSKGAWSPSPAQTISYVSCHDNYTLWDKLATSNPEDSIEDRIKMNKLASAVIFTSQGIPFIQAGEEMLRSKPLEDGTFSHNSYNLPDEVNSLKWNDLTKYQDVNNYYKGLIAFRKVHPALRMASTKEIQDNLKFIDGLPSNVVAYTIENSPNGEKAKSLYVVYNANKEAVKVKLPEGKWNVYINGEKAGTDILASASGEMEVAGISAMILVKDAVSYYIYMMIAAVIAGIVLVAVVIGLVWKKKKQVSNTK